MEEYYHGLAAQQEQTQRRENTRGFSTSSGSDFPSLPDAVIDNRDSAGSGGSVGGGDNLGGVGEGLVSGLGTEFAKSDAKKSKNKPKKKDDGLEVLLRAVQEKREADRCNSPTYSLIHSLTHSLSLIHSLTHSLTHSLVELVGHSLTHSLTHSDRSNLPPFSCHLPDFPVIIEIDRISIFNKPNECI